MTKREYEIAASLRAYLERLQDEAAAKTYERYAKFDQPYVAGSQPDIEMKPRPKPGKPKPGC